MKHSFDVLGKEPTKGEKNGMAKLTEEQVIEIRKQVGTHVYIASKYGITPENVCVIRKRRSWKHVI